MFTYHYEPTVVNMAGIPVHFETSGVRAWVEKQIDLLGDGTHALIAMLGSLRGRYEGWAEHANGRIGPIVKFRNGITDLGLNYLLNAGFHATTPITPWHMGLISNASYSALSASDTLASHAGWLEATDYSGTRGEWTEGAASARAMTNSTPVSFAITGTMSLKGAFLAEDDTIGETASLLFSTGVFASAYPVANTDTFKLIYTIQG